MQDSAKKRNVNIDLSLPNRGIEAYIDETKIKNALQNVLYNGIVYSEAGNNIDITLKMRKDSFVVTIKDHGFGMLPETLEDVFEPFQRGERAEQKYPDGAGLGLYIAKTYIEFHQGSININTKEDEGTTVEVVIPLRPKFSDL